MKNKNRLNYYTYQLDMVYLNVLAIIVMVVVGGVVFLLEKNDTYTVGNTGILFISMIFWLMLHEVLHGIGFGLFREVNKRNIVFGMALEKGVFYCMCKQKIRLPVIMTSLLFPFVFIGVVTLIIGMMIDSYMLVMLSIINISGAVGDLVMFYYFLRVPRDIIYLDLDDSTSFTVLYDGDLSYLHVPGIRLVETGEYDEKMVAHDKRRLVISKVSYLLLGVLLIFSILILLIGR